MNTPLALLAIIGLMSSLSLNRRSGDTAGSSAVRIPVRY